MVYDHFDINDFKIRNGKLETEFDRYLYMAMRINRCLCIEKLYELHPGTDKSMVLIYSIAQPWDHNCQNPLPNQPERSKREDIPCDNCVYQCQCSCSEHCLAVSDVMMRCSEHGG